MKAYEYLMGSAEEDDGQDNKAQAKRQAESSFFIPYFRIDNNCIRAILLLPECLLSSTLRVFANQDNL
jgi:hypothetical protein